MKHSTLFFSTLLLMIILSSCHLHTDHGPDGRDGHAYFGVDYTHFMPYSYWDNNPSIPLNPHLGEFYGTGSGLFDFEYFVTPHDYWYGTYEVWIEAGGHGGNYGEPGLDGRDTYLMLYCDPDGWSEERFTSQKGLVSYEKEKDHIKVKVNEPGYRFEVEMFRTDVLQRVPQGKLKAKEKY
jgi:hypothetical protein